MTALLIISTLGIMLLGYVVVRRIDMFMDRGGLLDGPQARANSGVLVYGAPGVAVRIRNMGVKCTALTSPALPESGFYTAIFVLSADDGKNLAVCASAKSADPGIFMIARCNNLETRTLYEKLGVGRVLEPGEPVEALLAQMWGAGR